MIAFIKNLFRKDDRIFGGARSPRWKQARNHYLKMFPNCAVCNVDKDLEVHHEVPVHVDKTQELLYTNLITLCGPHHFWVGHLGNWSSWNTDVRKDASEWRGKITNRPIYKYAEK